MPWGWVHRGWSELLARCLAAGGLGWIWEYGHWGPLLSLFLIPLVVLGKRKRERYTVALAYYLAGSHGIPAAATVFFGPGHLGEGIFLWLASSALLALGWAFADRPWRVLAVLVLDAVPPLGFFDWLSPLASAGVLFPGWGWLGFIAFLVTTWLVAQAAWEARQDDRHPGQEARGWSLDALIIASGIAFAANTAYHPMPVPSGWVGVNSNGGKISTSVVYNEARVARWLVHTQETAGKAQSKVVLTPEGMVEWWPGTAQEVENAVPQGQTWLVGVSDPAGPSLMTDAIMAVQHGKARRVFVSAFPVPVSMWHPWFRGHGYGTSDGVGFQAGWWEPARKIDGVRAWASICYDQLLPWVWLEGVMQSPQVVLSTRNEWWAKGSGIPQIQRATAWAWTRLMGAGQVMAQNDSRNSR